MHTVIGDGHAPAAQHAATSQAAPKARVAIAGATGYTGQELLRILGRHQGVSVTAAMSSGTGAARKLPALKRIWDGELTPLSAEALVRDADLVFMAVPDQTAAELGPALVEAGVRVVD